MSTKKVPATLEEMLRAIDRRVHRLEYLAFAVLGGLVAKGNIPWSALGKGAAHAAVVLGIIR